MKTKRIFACMTGLLLMVSVFAADKNLQSDITMVSFEQGWSDDESTLALRNNTSEEVKNVVFVITYLDMSGNEMDYEEYEKEVSIEPGKTKKIDIPGYESDRNYYYYKSAWLYKERAFKVGFQLKDYNVEKAAEEPVVRGNSVLSQNSSPQTTPSAKGGYLSSIVMILIMLLALTIVIGSWVLVAVMAKKRHRSVVGWLLLSLLISPVIVLLVLLFVGKNEEAELNGYNIN